MSTTALFVLLDYAKEAGLLTVGLLIYAQLRPYFARYFKRFGAVLEGLCFSVLIAVTMASPLALQGGVRIDLRATLISLAVVFGGPICGLVAGATAAVLRVLIGGPNTFGGIILVVFSFVGSLAYWKWIEIHHRRIGYKDLFVIGGGIAVYRIVLWLTLFGYEFTIQAMDAAWFGTLLLLTGSAVVLGSVVLLVEERRSLAQSVADSEARFRSVLDQLPTSLNLVDHGDRFVYVNKKWEELTGVAAAQALGRTRQEVWQEIGAPLEHLPIVKKAHDTSQPITTDPILFKSRGRFQWIIGTLFPVRNAKGEVCEIGTTGTDVTDLVVARENLSRREEVAQRHKNALLDAVHATRILDLPMGEAIHAITEIAGQTLDVDHTGIFRADYESRHSERLDLWLKSERRHLPAETETETSIWDLAENLNREGVLAMEDAAAEPLMAARLDYLRRHNVRSLMLAPIFVGDQFHGVVTFSTVGQSRKWADEEMHFARSMADVVALIILTDRHRESLAALDLIADGIYVESEDRRLIYANRASRQMAGQDVERSPQPFALPPEGFPRPPRAMTDDHDRHEISFDSRSGRRDLEIERHRIPHGGTIVLIHDITQHLSAERERKRLEEQLIQAHKLEALGEMAGGIAHDFNNLLGAIGGFARFLEEDLPREAVEHQYAQRILSACERGKAVVAQILSFAKLRNVERHALDLHVLLQGSLDLLRGLASPTTTISFDIDDTPLPIFGNDGQITQLLVNLCANAIEALGGKRGTVMVRVKRIPQGERAIDREERQVSAFDVKSRRRRMFGQLDREHDYARIDVSDSGKGISPSVMPRIFEPFFTTKHRHGGTGLGLAVVQSVVSLYSGALYVDSREGKGTNFSICLPLADMPIHVPAVGAAEVKSAGSERVLIVDDDVDVADMLSIGLGRLGYEVSAVNDPVAALAAFREDPDNWDVAILDRVMPEMDGITLAGRMRAVRSGLPVILCTGLDDGTFARVGGSALFDAFFTKPVEP